VADSKSPLTSIRKWLSTTTTKGLGASGWAILKSPFLCGDGSTLTFIPTGTKEIDDEDAADDDAADDDADDDDADDASETADVLKIDADS